MILQSNFLPNVETYKKLLNIASILYNMTIDECRDKFGLFTEKKWHEYLNKHQ